MKNFLELVQGNKEAYVLVISFITTVIVVNGLIDFAEKLIKYHVLIIISLLLFYLLALIAIRWRIWHKQ